MKILILTDKEKQNLLDINNKACNTNYQIKDIKNIIEYKDSTRNINLIEIIFKDYICQRFIKDTLEIDNFI